MGNKKKLKRTIQNLILIVLVFFLIWYFVKNSNDFKVLLSISPAQVFILLLVSMISPIFGTQYRKYAAKELDVKLDLIDWLGVASVSNLISLFIPFRGDLIISAKYYKKRCKLSYSKFVSITAGGVIIQILMVSVELLIGLLLFGLISKFWSWVMLLFDLIILFSCIIFIFLIKRYGMKVIRKLPMQKYIAPVGEGFITLLASPQLLKKSFLLQMGNQLVQACKFYLLLHFFGNEVSILFALIYSSMNILTDVFMLTPGNLGIKEVIIGAVSSLMGNGFSNGIGITLIIRIMSILVYLIYSAIFAIPVYNRLRFKGEQYDK